MDTFALLRPSSREQSRKEHRQCHFASYFPHRLSFLLLRFVIQPLCLQAPIYRGQHLLPPETVPQMLCKVVVFLAFRSQAFHRRQCSPSYKLTIDFYLSPLY